MRICRIMETYGWSSIMIYISLVNPYKMDGPPMKSIQFHRVFYSLFLVFLFLSHFVLQQVIITTNLCKRNKKTSIYSFSRKRYVINLYYSFLFYLYVTKLYFDFLFRLSYLNAYMCKYYFKNMFFFLVRNHEKKSHNQKLWKIFAIFIVTSYVKNYKIINI